MKDLTLKIPSIVNLQLSIVNAIDWFVVAIVIIGIGIFAFKCKIIYPIEWIGHAEEANYAEIADSLIHGKGISNDYIGYAYFFSPLKYPGITHPDAHYPPLYSFLIVPFFLILGKSAFAAKLPSLLISSFLLPVFLYWVVRRLSKSRITGLAAALSIITFPMIFSHSLRPDDDVLFPFMILASCFFIMKAMDQPKYFYLAGIFIGLTYYVKGSALVLVPAFFISCIILSSIHYKSKIYLLDDEWSAMTQSLHDGLKILRNRKMWSCFAIIFLVMLPWFIRNTIHFRNPIFSTENYAAGYIGHKGWEEGTYSLYWDKERPTLFTKLKQNPKTAWEKGKEFYKRYLWWSFIDISGKWDEFEAKDFCIYYTGIPAILGLLFFFVSNVYFFYCRRFAKYVFRLPAVYRVAVEKSHRVTKKILMPFYNRDFHVLWLTGVFMLTFLSICWEPITRLSFPMVLMTMAIGWTTYYVFMKQIFSWTKYSGIIASCVVVLLMPPILLRSAGEVYHNYKDAGWPYKEGGQSWMEAGKWLKENAPGSVTMTRNPWELHFYSDEKAIQIPRAELEKIITVMKFYKVTHIIPQLDIRPSLKPLVEGKIPGFKLVYDKGLKIYEIQYDLLPIVAVIRIHNTAEGDNP